MCASKVTLGRPGDDTNLYAHLNTSAHVHEFGDLRSRCGSKVRSCWNCWRGLHVTDSLLQRSKRGGVGEQSLWSYFARPTHVFTGNTENTGKVCQAGDLKQRVLDLLIVE